MAEAAFGLEPDQDGLSEGARPQLLRERLVDCSQLVAAGIAGLRLHREATLASAAVVQKTTAAKAAIEIRMAMRIPR